MAGLDIRELLMGPVSLLVMTLILWAFIYKLITEGRSVSKFYKIVFFLLGLPLGALAAFGALASISGTQTTAVLINPTLRLLQLQ